MSLTRQQFNEIQKQAEPLIYSWLKKDCRQLALSLEAELPSMENADPEMSRQAKKLIAKLKWVACDLINDEELYKLFRENLLEGLELEDNDLARLIDNKIAMTFGAGALGLTNNIIHAMRENIQPIGNQPIMVKNETRPVRPVIRNWLIDFLRETPNENPADVDISNYLFNNQNCKKLSPTDRDILGRILNFYNGLRAVAQEYAEREREQMILEPAEEQPAAPSKFQNLFPEQNEAHAISSPRQSSPAETPFIVPTPPAPFVQPPPKPEPAQQPTRPSSPYREPIEEQDLAGPPAAKTIATSPAEPKSGPMTQGNVVDLRDMNK